MLHSLRHHRFLKELPSVHRSAALFTTLPDKMADNSPPDTNVVQLCGNDNLAINKAVLLLQQGEVIAVPTDTVFGLACDASNSAAINKLYEIKGRDRNKPLAICVCSVSEVNKWGKTSYLPKGLLKSLLPGPVTVILERKERLNPDLNPGVKNVGIRVPGTVRHPFIDLVTSAFGYPLALTSANPSSEPNCIHIEEFRSLWPKLGAVFYMNVDMVGHDTGSREGSTIVDLTEPGKFRITRPGVAYEKTLKKLQTFYLEEVK